MVIEILKVNRRGGFSDRTNIKKQNTEIQLTEFDERTRKLIFNRITTIYNIVEVSSYRYEEELQNFIKYVYAEVFSQIVDARKYQYEDGFFKDIEKVIIEAEYDDILTLVEAIVEYFDGNFGEFEFVLENEECFYGTAIIFNKLFEKEYVGYRFIDQKISPISNELELQTINETLENSYDIVTEHIKKSHGLLADRDAPDYENSIKESISAVEAICQIITGIKGKEATLGNMLKQLEKNSISIHSALKSAFSMLYGYTSDANGIRHAGDIGGQESTFEEAKFMLISCCTFVNYLIGIQADR